MVMKHEQPEEQFKGMMFGLEIVFQTMFFSIYLIYTSDLLKVQSKN